ncbi:hypothetical protein QTP88_027026 [Uroleucon formosanum]
MVAYVIAIMCREHFKLNSIVEVTPDHFQSFVQWNKKKKLGQAILSENICDALFSQKPSVSVKRIVGEWIRVSPFEKQPTDLRLLPGQTGRFSCFVNSQPLPKIIWLKDNSPLVIDNRMTIFQSGALEIDDVRTEDNGAYRCNVTGLEIHSLSDPGVLTVVENEEAIKKLKAPEFVAKPYSTKALEGSIVTMDCAAVGNPRPQISWSKGGYPILLHLDTKFRIIGTGGLQIMQLNRNDEGNYVCRAKNSEGTIVVSAKIDVLVKPLFIYEPKDTLCFKEENVTLECKVTGKPPPSVIWLKNGDRIKPDEYIQFVNGTNLKIFGALVMDSGIFQCLASNVAGNIQSSAFLNVLDRDNLQDLNSSTNVSNNIVNLFSTTENPKDLKKKLISYSKTSDARVISTMLVAILSWINLLKPNGDVQDSDQTIKTVNSKSNQPAKYVVEIDLRRVVL